MDIVLGVSMTPTTVRMVLVEGEKADGVTVDHDVFDVTATEGTATSSAAEQVIAAVLGTKESADAGGHHLKSIGVTWSDHTDASALRDALAARGIDDVMLVSDGHAAAALAQAVGRAVGYDTTALLFIDRDTATLSVVQTDDGSVVKVLSRTLHSDDAMAVLTEMAAAVDAQDAAAAGHVRRRLRRRRQFGEGASGAPRQPAGERARRARTRPGPRCGAGSPPTRPHSRPPLSGSPTLRTPMAPRQAPPTPVLSAAETQLAPVVAPIRCQFVDGLRVADRHAAGRGRTQAVPARRQRADLHFRRWCCGTGISLAVSIRPTADKRPSPGQSALVPSTVAPAPGRRCRKRSRSRRRRHRPETIKAPVPVVQQAPQAPPRTVYVESAARRRAPAPPPAAPAPAPAAPPPAPAPAPPVVLPAPAPILPPPVVWYPRPQNPWNPPWEMPTRTPPKPTWTPPKPTWTPPWQQPQEEVPQEPQVPEVPQQPQWPQWPGSGGPGSDGPGSGGSGDFGSGGSGGSESGGRGGSRGSGGSGGSSGSGGSGNCFLIFCG